MTEPFNIIFDDFGICLLGYMISSIVYIFHKGIIL